MCECLCLSGPFSFSPIHFSFLFSHFLPFYTVYIWNGVPFFLVFMELPLFVCLALHECCMSSLHDVLPPALGSRIIPLG